MCQRKIAAALAVAAAFWTDVAQARPELQGIFQGSVGYTDNVFASPDDPPPEIPPREADVIGVLSPGVVYAVESAAQSQRLKYAYTANLYLTHSEAFSFSNELEYQGFFALSRDVSLLLGGNATQSHHNTANSLAGASASAVGAVFPGTAAFLLVRGSEALSARLSRSWRSHQGTALAVQTPIRADLRAPTTFTADNRLGADHYFRDDSLGAELGADYATMSDSVDAEGNPVSRQTQLVLRGVGRWRHDWGRYFTSQLDGGAMRVMRLNTNAAKWYPTGLALLGYSRRGGYASVTYEHTVRTSLFLGLSFLTDSVTAHGSLELSDDPPVRLGSTLGYEHGDIIDPTGELASTIELWVGDVALSYMPQDELELALRYQYTRQYGAELPPLPLSFERNLVLATVTFSYPPEEDMPRPYRRPMRVDRSDEIRGPLDNMDRSAPQRR